jgi:alpha-glucosidase
MDRAFPLYEKWGIEGVMVDFLDRDDQQAVQFVHRLCQKAAEHHLTVTLHGIYKPTGLRRTYPNLLTREAVRSLEYNKWDPAGIAPRHELIVPFTRMLAGPLDFHQGGFRAVGPSNYRPQHRGPVVVGTRARQLAMYVAYENYLPMVGDYPAAYRDQPGLDLIAGMPVTWDETLVLAASVGKHVCVARRSGTTWYVGTINNAKRRKIRIPLTFLGSSEYMAIVYADDVGAADMPIDRNALRIDRRRVSSTSTIEGVLAPAGGHVMQIDAK